MFRSVPETTTFEPPKPLPYGATIAFGSRSSTLRSHRPRHSSPWPFRANVNKSDGRDGAILSETDPGVEHRFGYTGRDWDADAELYYYRARWYDPVVGRFISEDPSGFAAGDENLSRYVLNSPVMLVDPSGLQPALPAGPWPGEPTPTTPALGYAIPLIVALTVESAAAVAATEAAAAVAATAAEAAAAVAAAAAAAPVAAGGLALGGGLAIGWGLDYVGLIPLVWGSRLVVCGIEFARPRVWRHF